MCSLTIEYGLRSVLLAVSLLAAMSDRNRVNSVEPSGETTLSQAAGNPLLYRGRCNDHQVRMGTNNPGTSARRPTWAMIWSGLSGDRQNAWIKNQAGNKTTMPCKENEVMAKSLDLLKEVTRVPPIDIGLPRINISDLIHDLNRPVRECMEEFRTAVSAFKPPFDVRTMMFGVAGIDKGQQGAARSVFELTVCAVLAVAPIG